MLDTKSFEPMVSLRLLQINNLSLEGKFLPNGLKWLQWRGCPLECISLDTLPRELAVLDLSNGQKIKRLWGLKSHKVYASAILCIILIMIAQTLVIATLFTIIFFSESGHMLNQFLEFQCSLQNTYKKKLLFNFFAY